MPGALPTHPLRGLALALTLALALGLGLGLVRRLRRMEGTGSSGARNRPASWRGGRRCADRRERPDMNPAPDG